MCVEVASTTASSPHMHTVDRSPASTIIVPIVHEIDFCRLTAIRLGCNSKV
jgi:hypothetical protein